MIIIIPGPQTQPKRIDQIYNTNKLYIVQLRQQCFFLCSNFNPDVENAAGSFTKKKTEVSKPAHNGPDMRGEEALPGVSHEHIRASGIRHRNSCGCNT